MTWSNINVDAIGLAAEVVDLRRELEQQATLLGKGSEREARLLAENAELQKENAALKAALDHQMNYQRELRADRDRLDWLQEMKLTVLHNDGKVFGRGVNPPCTRAAIDAAMKECK